MLFLLFTVGAIGRIESTGTRGVGLRFPRFIRDRDDKLSTQATNSEQIADLYFSQDNLEANANDEDEDEDLI